MYSLHAGGKEPCDRAGSSISRRTVCASEAIEQRRGVIGDLATKLDAEVEAEIAKPETKITAASVVN